MFSFSRISVITVVSLCYASALADLRPQTDAFVNHRISNSADLVSQLNNDSTVANRYMRHFGMTKSELAAYFSDLHLTSVTSPRTFTVYSVPQSGVVKMNREFLKKGEPIFSDSNGHAVLLAKGGNPLTLGPATVQKSNDNSGEVAESSSVSLRGLPTAPASESLLEDEKLIASTTFEPTMLAPETSSTAVTATGTAAQQKPTPNVPAVDAGLSNAALGNILGSIGTIGFAIGRSSGGGNFNGTPEPATLLVFAIGGGLATLRRRKK